MKKVLRITIATGFMVDKHYMDWNTSMATTSEDLDAIVERATNELRKQLDDLINNQDTAEEIRGDINGIN